MRRLLSLLSILLMVPCTWAAVNQALAGKLAGDPLYPRWASIIDADETAGEVQISSKIIRDRFGYVAVIKAGDVIGLTAARTSDPDEVRATGGFDFNGDASDIRMRYIPALYDAGSTGAMPAGVRVCPAFHSGAGDGDPWRRIGEGPRVTGDAADPGRAPAQGFWMAENEVSQEVFKRLWSAAASRPLVAGNPNEHHQTPQFDQADNPVERVTWNGVTVWLEQLNAEYTGYLPSGGARLPSERQWEYACRAGSASSFWSGWRLEPVDWSIVKHDEVTEAHDYNGRNPTEFDGMFERRWNNKTSAATQQSYLRGRLKSNSWTITTGARDGNGEYPIKRIDLSAKLTFYVNDYFMVGTSQPVEANVDTRYQRRAVRDYWGNHVPVLKRYRRLGADLYIEDPTMTAAYYLRWRHSDETLRESGGDYDPLTGATLGGSASADIGLETPDEDFALVEDLVAGGFIHYLNEHDLASEWVQDDAGDHCRNPLDGNDQSYYRLEVHDYVPLTDRYARVGGSFQADDQGGYCAVSYAGQRIMQKICARYNTGVFDPSGSFWGATMPGQPESHFDREDIESMLLDVALANGVAGASPTVLTVSSGTVTSVNNDRQTMLTMLRAANPTGTMIGNKYVQDSTVWALDVEVTFKWDGVSGLAAAEFPGWSGYDVKAIDAGQLVPNPWGLFNMLGNVAEWTSDVWDGESPLDVAGGPVQMPLAGRVPSMLWRPIAPDAVATTGRVVRGGSWRRGATYARSASRDRRPANAVSLDLTDRVDDDLGAVDGISTTTYRPGFDDVGFRFIIPE